LKKIGCKKISYVVTIGANQGKPLSWLCILQEKTPTAGGLQHCQTPGALSSQLLLNWSSRDVNSYEFSDIDVA
jgi:hypothetical protein